MCAIGRKAYSIYEALGRLLMQGSDLYFILATSKDFMQYLMFLHLVDATAAVLMMLDGN